MADKIPDMNNVSVGRVDPSKTGKSGGPSEKGKASTAVDKKGGASKGASDKGFGGKNGLMDKTQKAADMIGRGKDPQADKVGDQGGGAAQAVAEDQAEQQAMDAKLRGVGRRRPGKGLRNATLAGKAGTTGAKVGILAKAMGFMQMAAGTIATGLSSAAAAGMNVINAIIGWVVNAAQAVGSAIATAFAAVTSAVGTALGIGAAAATVIATGGLVLVVATAVMAGGVVVQQSQIAQYDGALIDCSEDVNALTAKFGQGERQIPETYEGHDVGTISTCTYPDNFIPGMPNFGGTRFVNPCKIAADAWVADGHKFGNTGAALWDGCYMGAVALESFGKSEGESASVGDLITIYFDTGDGVDLIICDSKCVNDSNYCKWGHVHGNQVCVVEIWSDEVPSGFDALAGDLPNGRPNRVTSFTNHGPAPQFVAAASAAGSSLEQANDGVTSATSNAIRHAKDNCVQTYTYDNSSIASAAVSYAYSHKVSHGEGYDGTALYLKVWGNIFPGDPNSRSCDRSVATAVRWSGSDDDFPAGNTGGIDGHCASSPKWKFIRTTTGTIDDIDGLEPGDIVVISGHVQMYVGNELIKSMEASIMNGDSNVGDIPEGACYVSGSIGENGAVDADGIPASRAPGIGTGDGIYTYNVYRCIKPDHSTTYASAGE